MNYQQKPLDPLETWYREGVYHGVPAIFCTNQDCTFVKPFFAHARRIPSSCPDCARRAYQNVLKAEYTPKSKTKRMWGES